MLVVLLAQGALREGKAKVKKTDDFKMWNVQEYTEYSIQFTPRWRLLVALGCSVALLA